MSTWKGTYRELNTLTEKRALENRLRFPDNTGTGCGEGGRKTSATTANNILTEVKRLLSDLGELFVERPVGFWTSGYRKVFEN